MPDYRLLESGTLRATETATNLRALESYVPAGVVYTDDFNRADTTTPDASGVGLGAAWNAPGWYIGSNAAHRANGGANDLARFLTDIGSTDMWVEVNLGSGWNFAYCVLNLRSVLAITSVTCYMAFIPPAGTPVEIGKQSSGSYSTITSTPITADTTPYKARFEVEGTALRYYRDGVLKLSTTDSSISTGTYCGLNQNANDQLPPYDNFRCGPMPYTP